MDNRKLYLDADRFEDFVTCKIEEVQLAEDYDDPSVAIIQCAWIDALEWVCDLIGAESEVQL